MVADDVVRDDSLISIESSYYLRLKRAVIPNTFCLGPSDNPYLTPEPLASTSPDEY
jgi:hypothetical protein